MKIAVARVKNISNLEAVFLTYFVNVPQRSRQFCSWDDSVLDVVSGRKPSHGAESILAAFPQQVAFARVTSYSNFTGMMKPPPARHIFSLPLHCFSHAVHFKQQHRRAIDWESRVNV